MPAEEGAAPAEQVPGPGAEQQEAAEGEDVGVEHPRQLAAREAEARWMWGRATLTMVVSSTTISWAVRMTNRNRAAIGAAPGASAGRGAARAVERE